MFSAFSSAKKTVAQVMDSFYKTIEELGAVAEEQAAEAEYQKQIAAEAQASAETASAEAANARVTADKLRALLAP